MPTESGDMKLLGNFRKLIDHVSGETTYKPSNDILKLYPVQFHVDPGKFYRVGVLSGNGKGLANLSFKLIARPQIFVFFQVVLF